MQKVRHTVDLQAFDLHTGKMAPGSSYEAYRASLKPRQETWKDKISTTVVIPALRSRNTGSFVTRDLSKVKVKASKLS